MALKITINLPEKMTQEVLDQVTEGAAYNMGYQDMIDIDVDGEITSIPNPITKFDFLKLKFIEDAMRNYEAYAINKASEAAGKAKQEEIDLFKQSLI